MKQVLILFTILASVLIFNTTDAQAQTSIVFPDDIVQISREVSQQVGIPQEYILAVMHRENSYFNPKLVSSTNDHGLMQINKVNHSRFRAAGFSDIYDKRQNIHFGAMMIKWAYDESPSNLHKVFMTYNMGGGGARRALSRGISSTAYSRYVTSLINIKHTWRTKSGQLIFGQKIDHTKPEPVEDILNMEETDEFESVVFDPEQGVS